MTVRWRVARVTLAGLAMLVALTACAENDEVGTGYLDVGDLASPVVPNHFTGDAVALEGRLSLRTNGCVTVVVDGVERVPLWPEGTVVAQASQDLNRYTVTLPGGLVLTVDGASRDSASGDGASGDSFSAHGIIDDNAAPFEVEAGLATKVGSFLAYCGVQSLPIAFPDVGTFINHGT